MGGYVPPAVGQRRAATGGEQRPRRAVREFVAAAAYHKFIF